MTERSRKGAPRGESQQRKSGQAVQVPGKGRPRTLENTDPSQATRSPVGRDAAQDKTIDYIEAPVSKDTTDFDATQQVGPKKPKQAVEEKTVAEPSVAAAKAPAKSQKTSVLGDYRLLKKLGAGGMGAVYKAHQEKLDRIVALKVLPKNLAANPTLVQRFIREAKVMAKLDHPNILRCFDVGEAQGFHFLAMEYVDGGSLQDWLAKLGKLSVGDAVNIILQCARGLQHAHEAGLIHRDIKPENILITKKGVAKVADLGLAKAVDDDLSLTKSGTGAGTPLYMPPEQARDVKHVDHRSDIYSLGCMFYRMLAGDVPFSGDTLVEVVTAKEHGKFVPLRQKNEDVPSRLELIIEKMMAAKPEHRYQSCQEIIDALEELELANPALSFVEGATKAVVGKAEASKATDQGAAPEPTQSPEGKTSAEMPSSYIWYIKLNLPDGRNVTRKVTKDKLIGLIKNDAIMPDTPASRDYRERFAPIATFSDFTQLFHAKATQQKAEKKGKKFRDLYEQIEKEERRRQWKRWWGNLFLRFGGFVWLVCVIAILLVVGAIAFMFFQEAITEWARNIGLI